MTCCLCVHVVQIVIVVSDNLLFGVLALFCVGSVVSSRHCGVLIVSVLVFAFGNVCVCVFVFGPVIYCLLFVVCLPFVFFMSLCVC